MPAPFPIFVIIIPLRARHGSQKYRACAPKPIQIGAKSPWAATRMIDRLAAGGNLIAGVRLHFQASAHSIAFSLRGIFTRFALAIERTRSP
jgi:hypothetical protein